MLDTWYLRLCRYWFQVCKDDYAIGQSGHEPWRACKRTKNLNWRRGAISNGKLLPDVGGNTVVDVVGDVGSKCAFAGAAKTENWAFNYCICLLEKRGILSLRSLEGLSCYYFNWDRWSIVKALLKISIIAFQKSKEVSIVMKSLSYSTLFPESNVISRCCILSWWFVKQILYKKKRDALWQQLWVL